MRDALSALTNRGRAFLAAGATTVVCALVLGYDELVRIAGLLVALPLVTAWSVGHSRYRLGLVRTLAPARVAVGSQATVQLELTNDGRMPTGLLLLEEVLPYVLGPRPRFVIDRMGPLWKRTIRYTVRPEVRGKLAVGPMTVRLSDPFGLIELTRTFHARSALVVTPRVTPLPPIPLSGVWTGSGDNRPRAFATGSAEDVTVREYRQGDDLRRVHWRTSAKAGELMVRREEQPWQSRATVFVDTRAHVHRGSGAGSSLEHAVAVAASAAVHLTQRGFVVRLVTAQGEEHAGWHEHGSAGAETGPLLEALAVVREAHRPTVDLGWLQEAGQASGLTVAVLGAVDDSDHATLVRMRHGAASALAVLLDVEAWDPARPASEARPAPQTAWLAGRGWRVARCGPTDPLPRVWQSLGAVGRAGRARPVDPEPVR